MVEHQLNAEQAGQLLFQKVEPTHHADKWWKDNAKALLTILNGDKEFYTINEREFRVIWRTPDKMQISVTTGFVPCGVVARSWLETHI